MNRRQEIELRLSEIRERLSRHAGGEELEANEEEALRAEMIRLEAEYRVEVRAQQSEEADPDPDGAPASESEDGGEAAEFLAVRERCSLGAFFEAAAGGTDVDGAERELRSAAGLGDSPGAVVVPVEMLLGLDELQAPVELRADAPTNLQALTGTNSDRWIGRLFRRTDAAFAGVRFVSQSPGDYTWYELTAGVTAVDKAVGVAVDAVAATVEFHTVKPERMSSRYLFRIEDAARFGQLESQLRMDMRKDFTEQMDKKVLALLWAARYAANNNADDFNAKGAGSTEDAATFRQMMLSVVDGYAASQIGSARALMSVKAYRNLAAITRGTGASAYELAEYPNQVRLTPWLLDTGNSNKTGQVLVRGVDYPKPGMEVPVWKGFSLIRDIYTGAAKGEVSLTAHMLYQNANIDLGGYRRGAYRFAA